MSFLFLIKFIFFIFRCHPVLRRKLVKIFINISKYIKCLRTIKVESEFKINLSRNQQILNASSMLQGVMTKDQQVHFEMLAEFWK